MLKMIDLFAGCGGLTEGFLQTSFYETVACLDWDFQAIKTLKKRFQKKWNYKNDLNRFLHFDIQRNFELFNGFDDPFYGKHPGLNKIIGKKKIDLIIGGPPCQAYSLAGRVQDKNGMRDDYRNYLFENYINILEHFKPTAFVFENVQGILSAKPGDSLIVERIRNSFSKADYVITDDLKGNALIDLSFYNVPQKRKRVIIFGCRKDMNGKDLVKNFYDQLLSKKNKSELVVKSAFHNLPKIIPLEIMNKHKKSHKIILNNTSHVLNHEPRFHNERDIEIFRLLAKDIKSKNNKYLTVESLKQLYFEKTGKTSKFHKYNVIREDRPSNTIPAHLYKDGLRHIHPDPDQARSITVREAARIQTFDDDFEFLGSKSDQYKMIGNAVPPVFARTIAEIVSNLLS